MPHVPHIYVVAPLSADTFALPFGGCAVVEIDSVPDHAPPFGRPAGLIVVRDGDGSVQRLSRFLRAPVGAEQGWVGVVADEKSGSLRIFDISSPAAAETPEPREEEASKMSVLRHSINNALTSALAETQFSLMNDLDEETFTSLKTVEAKLKSIRDIVAATRARPAAAPPRAEVAF